MSELSNEASQLLNASGVLDGPSPDALRKLRAGLAVATGVGMSGATGAAASGGSPALISAARGLAKTKAIVVAVAIGAVGFGSGVVVGRQFPQSAPVSEVAASVPSPVLPPIASRATPAATTEQPHPPPAERERPASRDSAPTARVRAPSIGARANSDGGKHEPADRASTVAPVSSLAAELELMRAAGLALSQHPDRTLELLDQHAARHGDGQLVQERESLRVLALCALGRTDDAARIGRAFLARWPDSPHAGRLRASCIAARLDVAL